MLVEIKDELVERMKKVHPKIAPDKPLDIIDEVNQVFELGVVLMENSDDVINAAESIEKLVKSSIDRFM